MNRYAKVQEIFEALSRDFEEFKGELDEGSRAIFSDLLYEIRNNEQYGYQSITQGLAATAFFLTGYETALKVIDGANHLLAPVSIFKARVESAAIDAAQQLNVRFRQFEVV